MKSSLAEATSIGPPERLQKSPASGAAGAGAATDPQGKRSFMGVQNVSY